MRFDCEAVQSRLGNVCWEQMVAFGVGRRVRCSPYYVVEKLQGMSEWDERELASHTLLVDVWRGLIPRSLLFS